MFRGVKAILSDKRHLRHWAEVCRFIDAEPYRSIFYPFLSRADPPHEAPLISARLLQRMERCVIARPIAPGGSHLAGKGS